MRRKIAAALAVLFVILAFPAQAEGGFSRRVGSLEGKSFLAMYQAGEEADYWFEAGADTAFVQRMEKRIQSVEDLTGEMEPIDVFILRDSSLLMDRLAEPVFQDGALILTLALEEDCLPMLANACLREDARWVGEGVAYLVEYGAPDRNALKQGYSSEENLASLMMDDLCFLPSLRDAAAIELSRMTAADWWLRGGTEAPDRGAWLAGIGAGCEFAPPERALPDFSARATAQGEYDVHICTARAEYDIAMQESRQYTIVDEASLRDFLWHAESAMEQIAAYLAPYAAQGLADTSRTIAMNVDESRWEMASYTDMNGRITINYWPKDCLEHEITHAYTSTAFSETWMDEGLATWMENAVACEYQFVDEGRDVRLAWLRAAARGAAHMYSFDPLYVEYLAELLRLYQLGGGTLETLDPVAFLDARAILSLGYFNDLEGAVWYEVEQGTLKDIYGYEYGGVWYDFDGGELTYAGAGSLFAYLVQETSLEDALTAMRAPERFEEIFGGDYQAASSRWRSYLEETYRLEAPQEEETENPEETLAGMLGGVIDALEGLLIGEK